MRFQVSRDAAFVHISRDALLLHVPDDAMRFQVSRDAAVLATPGAASHRASDTRSALSTDRAAQRRLRGAVRGGRGVGERGMMIGPEEGRWGREVRSGAEGEGEG